MSPLRDCLEDGVPTLTKRIASGCIEKGAPSLAQRPQRANGSRIEKALSHILAYRQGLDRDRNAVELRERKAVEGFVVRVTLIA